MRLQTIALLGLAASLTGACTLLPGLDFTTSFGCGSQRCDAGKCE